MHVLFNIIKLASNMFKFVPIFVLVAVATDALAARIARSPGGAGWQGSSGYNSSPSIAAARSSGWNSGGRSSGSNGSGGSSSYGRSFGGSSGWADSGVGRSAGWGDANSDWAGSNGYGAGSNGFNSRSGSDGYNSGLGHGSGLTGSIDFRSNDNAWQAAW